ncbi:MAG TPA: hypothetical protein VFD63_14755 [Pyrinomonadaceae bacterium]|jgi:hypothetical protein|nr:hypothetical protein [Pyrinomonadaceae bacterium]
MEKTKTKISRSWGTTFGFLIGALVLFVLSILLFMTIVEGPVTIGVALIPGVAGVVLLFMAFGGSGRTSCPLCNKSLNGLSTKANDGVLCTGCHNYLEGQGGLLWQTDEDRVADEALFTSPLPEQFIFPRGCSVCGGKEVGLEQIRMSSQNASSAITAPTVGVTTRTIVSVEVPHCAQHKGGAQLSGTPSNAHIKFRSYRYLRAFCQANGTVPG